MTHRPTTIVEAVARSNAERLLLTVLKKEHRAALKEHQGSWDEEDDTTMASLQLSKLVTSRQVRPSLEEALEEAVMRSTHLALGPPEAAGSGWTSYDRYGVKVEGVNDKGELEVMVSAFQEGSFSQEADAGASADSSIPSKVAKALGGKVRFSSYHEADLTDGRYEIIHVVSVVVPLDAMALAKGLFA